MDTNEVERILSDYREALCDLMNTARNNPHRLVEGGVRKHPVWGVVDVGRAPITASADSTLGRFLRAREEEWANKHWDHVCLQEEIFKMGIPTKDPATFWEKAAQADELWSDCEWLCESLLTLAQRVLEHPLPEEE